jgi:hypothetical protein
MAIILYIMLNRTMQLYSGDRRPKTDPIFEALGATDELNACVGIAIEYCEDEKNGLQSKYVSSSFPFTAIAILTT